MMSSVPHTPWVNVYINEFFICLQTASGYRGYALDPNVPLLFLALNVSEMELGDAVIWSLAQSRQLELAAAGVFFDYRRIQRDYEIQVNDMLAHACCKNRKTLFREMRLCQVVRYADNILISPTRHEKLESWSGDGITEESKILLIIDSPAAEIGRSLKECFGRCL